MSDTKLIRIARTNERETHVIAGHTFKKERNWYKVPTALADLVKGERMSELDPNSPLVFEVVSEAAALASAKIQDEAKGVGSVERPAELITAPVEVSEASAPPAPAPARVGRRTASA